MKVAVYFFKGAYKGRKDLYNKRISPFFSSSNKAYAYKDANKIFSLSLSESLVTRKIIKV